MRKLSRLLQVSSLILTIILAPVLSACSLFSSRDAHTIIFWTSVTNDIDIAAQQQIISAFEQTNPQWHVRLVREPSQGTGDATALITAVRGGTPPDVYLLDRFSISQQAAIGLLSDLKPFISKYSPDLARHYLPFAWREASYQGDSYGLPMDTDARALFYNKDLLRQAGIDPGILAHEHGPPTIAEVMRLGERLDKTDAHGNYTQLGLIPWGGQGFHTTWALSFGAHFYDARTCQVTMTEPALQKTFHYFVSWAKALNYKKVDTFLATYQPPNAPPSQTPFFTGHLGMAIEGNWLLQNIQHYAPDLHYGVTYLPVEQRGDRPFTWSGGFALVMPKGAYNTEGGYRFMSFMAGPEGQRIYTRLAGQLPTWTALLEQTDEFHGPQRFFTNMLKFAISRPPLPVGAQISDALDTAQQAVLLGTQTPIQALQQAQERVQPQMQQYCPFNNR
jgi:multiple sugar transport system substrate-binding protein